MAEQLKPNVTVYDLTRTAPEELKLTGLSAPKFDGVNYFRQPTGPVSTLRFSTAGSRFVQFEYQLYSPGSTVTVKAALDGAVLDQRTFPAGKFIDNAVWGGFVPAGQHRISLTYSCSPGCTQPLSQYWTKLTIVEDERVKAHEDTGLGTERLWLNAPASELKISGTGPVSFDGVNYRRPVEEGGFTLSWPEGKQPLNVGFTVFSVQPLRVTTRVGNELISVSRGDGRAQVSPVLSLVGHPKARSVTVEVECLSGGQGCASLYFPYVSVLSPAPLTQNLPMASFGAVLLLTVITALLGFFPGRRRG